MRKLLLLGGLIVMSTVCFSANAEFDVDNFRLSTRTILHCETSYDPRKTANFRIADDASWFGDEENKLYLVRADAVWIYQSKKHEVLKTSNLIYFKPYELTLQYTILKGDKGEELSTTEYNCTPYTNPFKDVVIKHK